MKKKYTSGRLPGILLMVLGLVLISVSAILVGRNFRDSDRAGEQASENLQAVEAAIAEKQAPEPEKPEETEAAGEIDPEMTEVVIKGNAYIGYLDIPDYELRLPVMSQWSYDKLQVAPCRQFGSVKTDDLVIAAHNYPTHFGHLKDLTSGTAVTFTDMDGAVIPYRVAQVTTIDPDAEALVRDSEFDLVLYTCTLGGASRVMAGCIRAAE